MVDRNEVVKAFKEKFSKMSPVEREVYLKKMGFSFEEETSTRKTPSSIRNQRSRAVHKAACARRESQITKKKLSSGTLGAVMAMKVSK